MNISLKEKSSRRVFLALVPFLVVIVAALLWCVFPRVSNDASPEVQGEDSPTGPESHRGGHKVILSEKPIDSGGKHLAEAQGHPEASELPSGGERPSTDESEGPISGADEAAAKAAYLNALNLEKAGDLAKAEQAYRRTAREHKGTTGGLMSLMQLAGVLALLGKTEEAWTTYVQYDLQDLEAAREKGDPTPGLPLDQIRARARIKTARACLSRRDSRLKALQDAKAQYDRLLQDYPDSPLANDARKHAERLRREIQQESRRQGPRQEIVEVVSSLENALKDKNTDAIIAQLALGARSKEARTHLDAFFRSPEYKAHTYEIVRIEFNDGLSEATVDVKAYPAGSVVDATRDRLFFVKTADGWKLKHL